ncbi:unnamed protein product [Mytilus edulis]|uniref:Uncharacterized protein n=1 Tax=Mytilus edulis TaxID=6550 RepID=A0A8S3T1X7_MYTED|nr:unnamed protein product [Mytilus edulis]
MKTVLDSRTGFDLPVNVIGKIKTPKTVGAVNLHEGPEIKTENGEDSSRLSSRHSESSDQMLFFCSKGQFLWSPSGVATAPPLAPALPVAVSLTSAVAPSTTVPDSQASSSSHGTQVSDHASPLDGLQKLLLDFGESFKAEFSTLSSRMTLLENRVSSHQPSPAKSVECDEREDDELSVSLGVMKGLSSLMRMLKVLLLPSASQVLGTAEHFLAATGQLLNSEDTVVPAEVRSFLLQLDKALGSSQLLLMGSIANCTLSKRAEFLENISIAEPLKDSLLQSPLIDKMFGLSVQQVQEELSKTLLQSKLMYKLLMARGRLMLHLVLIVLLLQVVLLLLLRKGRITTANRRTNPITQEKAQVSLLVVLRVPRNLGLVPRFLPPRTLLTASPGENLQQVPQKSIPVGGRLSFFLNQWKKITSDCYVLSIIRGGLTLQFKNPPPLSAVPISLSHTQDPVKCQLLSVEVDTMLQKAAIEEVSILTLSPGFYSRLFLVPKKTGGMRPVIDLSILNKFLIVPHFKMETNRSIRASILPGMWTTSLDLSDAFIPIWTIPSQGILPNQIEGSDRLGHQLFSVPRLPYLLEKSEIIPSQDFVFLGEHFLTSVGLVLPPEEKFTKLCQKIHLFLTVQSVTARQFLQLLGLLNSLADVIPLGRLHIRPLQFYLHKLWIAASQEWEALIPITQPLFPHLQWWLVREKCNEGPMSVPSSSQSNIIHRCLHPRLGSISGGAYNLRSLESRSFGRAYQCIGNESSSVCTESFPNVSKESVCHSGHGQHNSCSLSQESGGTHSPSLYQIARDILLLCFQLQVHLVVRHIAGQLNILADTLSRSLAPVNTEWELLQVVFKAVTLHWGHLR